MSLVYAPAFGVTLVGVALAFTLWLSCQTLTCPDWAFDCVAGGSAVWIKNHLPLVQGIVSTAHGIGLALFAYPSFVFAEAAVWPILSKRPHSLKSLEMYLSATRGSVPSLFQAFFNAGTRRASLIMLFVRFVTTMLQVDRIIVGQAYSLGNITKTYGIQYSGGAGIGLPFYQTNPPSPVPGPASAAKNIYISWANGLAQEPLPAARDFIVDRVNLSVTGNFQYPGSKSSKVSPVAGRNCNLPQILPTSMGTSFMFNQVYRNWSQ